MKYKVKSFEIREDNTLFEGITNLSELSRATGIHLTYLSAVKTGRRVVGEKAYPVMKRKIEEFKKGIDKVE